MQIYFNMETLTIELKNPKARRIIDDFVDLGIISLNNSQPSRAELWEKLNKQLPQTEPDITEEEIMEEIKTYRMQKKIESLHK